MLRKLQELVQETRALITTVASLRPVIPPWRPEISFKVHSINRSAPGAASCAACIARSRAFCTLPFLAVPLNVFSGGIVILRLVSAAQFKRTLRIEKHFPHSGPLRIKAILWWHLRAELQRLARKFFVSYQNSVQDWKYRTYGLGLSGSRSMSRALILVELHPSASTAETLLAQILALRPQINQDSANRCVSAARNRARGCSL
jgi:hypothetical protein